MSQIIKFNFLRNIFGFDVVILIGNENQFPMILPAVFFYPSGQNFFVNVAQQTGQIDFLNRFECDAHNMAYEFPNGIIEAGNVHDQLVFDQIPELLEIARLQNACQINDFLHSFVLSLGGQQQAFAQRKIGVRQIGQSLQQYGVRDAHVQTVWIELVQFKNGQIRFEVVLIVAGLLLNIFLDDGQMFWIVPVCRQ